VSIRLPQRAGLRGFEDSLRYLVGLKLRTNTNYMSSKYKTVALLAAIALAACSNYHNERVVAKQRVGNDTVIIKETSGEALSGGMLVFRKTPDSLHKLYMNSFVYPEVHILGLNAGKDTLLIKAVATGAGPLPKDTVRHIYRIDTLRVPWVAPIASWRLDNTPFKH
jgi:hypothetical protein